MAKRKQTSEATAKSQEKLLAAGGERLTLTLSPDDAALWRKLLRRYGGHRGAKMRAFRDAVASVLNVDEMTPEQALKVFEGMVREKSGR